MASYIRLVSAEISKRTIWSNTWTINLDQNPITWMMKFWFRLAKYYMKSYKNCQSMKFQNSPSKWPPTSRQRPLASPSSPYYDSKYVLRTLCMWLLRPLRIWFTSISQCRLLGWPGRGDGVQLSTWTFNNRPYDIELHISMLCNSSVIDII